MIRVKEENYVVGTTVELEKVKDILYTKLKNIGLDVGDMNGFEAYVYKKRKQHGV